MPILTKRSTYLFRVSEFPHEGFVVLLHNTLGVAGDGFDVRLEGALQQLVHLGVVIVIVPDAEHTVDVVPNRAAEGRRVYVRVVAHPANRTGARAWAKSWHRVRRGLNARIGITIHCLKSSKFCSRAVGQVAGDCELLVQQRADLRVQPVGEGEALVLPWVILRAEGRDLRLSRLRKVLVRELGVLHEAQQVRLERRFCTSGRHCNQTTQLVSICQPVVFSFPHQNLTLQNWCKSVTYHFENFVLTFVLFNSSHWSYSHKYFKKLSSIRRSVQNTDQMKTQSMSQSALLLRRQLCQQTTEFRCGFEVFKHKVSWQLGRQNWKVCVEWPFFQKETTVAFQASFQTQFSRESFCKAQNCASFPANLEFYSKFDQTRRPWITTIDSEFCIGGLCTTLPQIAVISVQFRSTSKPC